MKATYTFDQVEHLVRLAKQKGVTGDRLQDHFDMGALSDVFEILDPKKITLEARDAARRAYGLPPLIPLLEPVGAITIPALLGRFNAREELILNYGAKAKPGVRIAYVDAELLDVIEEPVVETAISYARLTRPELDGPILTSLGNRPDLAVLLRQVYWLMVKQPNGRPGTLLNDGRANIFYLPGLTRVVFVCWLAGRDGWHMDASSVTLPVSWHGGRQVFSSNSLAAVAA